MEKVDLPGAVKLMNAANTLRPQGTLIKKKLEEYAILLKASN
jgi:hypothetical protein